VFQTKFNLKDSRNTRLYRRFSSSPSNASCVEALLSFISVTEFTVERRAVQVCGPGHFIHFDLIILTILVEEHNPGVTTENALLRQVKLSLCLIN
jgi:hypothetical protein